MRTMSVTGRFKVVFLVVCVVVIGVVTLLFHMNVDIRTTDSLPLAARQQTTFRDTEGVMGPDPQTSEDESLLPRQGRSKVLIIGATKGGTTFTGALFNNHPDVCYFYEPFLGYHTFAKKYNSSIQFLDGSEPLMDRPMQVRQLWRHNLHALVRNEFYRLDSAMLVHIALGGGRKTRTISFTKCFRNVPRDLTQLRRCLPILQKTCNSAKASAYKILRLNVGQTLTLLQTDPEVKVLFLIRDPRAVVNSRHRTFGPKNSAQSPQMLCTEDMRNIETMKTLRALFPGQVATVRYEDIATNPFPYAEALLGFAGLDMNPQLRDYLWSITSTGKNIPKKNGSVMRGNSTLTAHQWRLSVTPDEIEKLSDHRCLAVLQKMGYLPLEGEALRNLNVPFYRHCSEVEDVTVCLG